MKKKTNFKIRFGLITFIYSRMSFTKWATTRVFHGALQSFYQRDRPNLNYGQSAISGLH
jgi:hypothetical protein